MAGSFGLRCVHVSREGVRERGREGEREGGREGGRDGGRWGGSREGGEGEGCDIHVTKANWEQ